MINYKEYWKIIKQSFIDFGDLNPFRHGAAIAFYTIFSLPGILIIAIMIAGGFYEQETVRMEFLSQIESLIGASTADQVRSIMEKASFNYESYFMKIVGGLTLIVSTTTVFASLQQSMNDIWHIKPKPNKGIIKLVFTRLLSLAMVASVGFLLMVSLVADTLISVLNNMLNQLTADWSYYVIWAVNVAVSLSIVTFVFALIFKVLPDAKIKWSHVWVGAIVTTVLFVIGKTLIGYYLGQSSVGDAYGAAGSLVILLTWVYYSVIILLYGTQFTYTYNQIKGNKIIPVKQAVSFEIQEIENDENEV